MQEHQNPDEQSAFLLTMKEDSIEGIYDTLKQTAKISQSAGGIGLAFIISAQPVVILVEPTEPAMVSFRCCEYLTILPVM